MRIQKVEGDHPLYKRYPAQSSHQNAYIELDFSEKLILADWDAEIGNGVPFAVFHGLCQRFDCSVFLSSEQVNHLLEDIQDWANEALAGFDEEWDGSNWVAVFTEDAQRALDAIRDRVRDEQAGDVIVIGDWADWFIDYDGLVDAFKGMDCYCDFELEVLGDIKADGHVLGVTVRLMDYVVKEVVDHIDDVTLSGIEEMQENYPLWLTEQEKVKEAMREGIRDWVEAYLD